jgi:hypothetical protein
VSGRIMRFVMMMSGCYGSLCTALADMHTISSGHCCDPRTGL